MRGFLLTLAILFFAPGAFACTGETICKIDGRGYHVLEPDNWDGESPLPVLLHFHGWGRQGDLIVKHRRIAGATRPRGVLLIAPNGLGRSWDFWHPGSRDTPFAEAILSDIQSRYPIDPDQIYVSGYSWGSNMAWRFACETEVPIRAMFSIAGTLDQDETCAQAPGAVHHVHGLTDTVLDFPKGPNGDLTYAVSLWRDLLGCAPERRLSQWQAVSWLTHTRYAWDCEKGAVTLDVHSASHLIPRGWIARQLDDYLRPEG